MNHTQRKIKRLNTICAWLALAVIAVGGLCLLTAAAQAQRVNTYDVGQLPGSTVAAKITAAQRNCSAAIPCVLILGPELAGYSTGGTIPAKGANEIWLDYRSASLGLNVSSLSSTLVGGKALASSFAGADCVAKAMAADAQLGVKGGVILITSACDPIGLRVFSTAGSVAANFHNRLEFTDGGVAWSIAKTINFASGGTGITGCGFNDKNNSAPCTYLNWTGAGGAVDMITATGAVGNRLDRMTFEHFIADCANVCRYTLRMEKLDEPTVFDVRLKGGVSADSYTVDSTGSVWFNASWANCNAACAVFDWGTGGLQILASKISPQQGMTDCGLVLNGNIIGGWITVEEDNNSSPFVGHLCITGYDANSSRPSAPAGGAGAPNTIQINGANWVTTGTGVTPSQGADILVSGTSANKSNAIAFNGNSATGLSISATTFKFDWTINPQVWGGQSSGHTNTATATVNALQPQMMGVTVGDTNAVAAGSSAIVVRSVVTGQKEQTNAPQLLPDGVVGTPAVAYTSDPTTGFYRYGAGAHAFSCAGTACLRLDNALLAGVLPATWQWGFGSSGVTTMDTSICRDSANVLSVSTAAGACDSSGTAKMRTLRVTQDNTNVILFTCNWRVGGNTFCGFDGQAGTFAVFGVNVTTSISHSIGGTGITTTDANGFASLGYRTNTNCQLGGASGTTSPAACGAAAAGMVAVPASQTTYTVNTTASQTNSEIFVQQVTDNSGLPSSPTCSATATAPIQSSRVAGTSFTITQTSVAAVTCFKYWIVNR